MRNLLLLLILLSSLYSSAQETTGEFHPEFVHTVLFWLNNPEDATERSTFKTNLELLLQESDYTATNFIGTPPTAKREVVDDSFDFLLIVTFPSSEAQDNYQKEAAHLRFIETTRHLWKKVVVYDAEGKLINWKG